MGDYERPLLWKVVVQVGDDLHSHVCLTGTRGPDHHGEAVVCACSYGLHLGGGESDGVPVLNAQCRIWAILQQAGLVMWN